MVYRLDSLWHYSVVGCNHQNNNIGDLRTTGPHQGKGFVTGGIEKYDFSAVLFRFYLVGTDVLGNAAVLAGYHVGFTDSVEQLGFTMVYMSHNRDNRWARFYFALFVFLGFDYRFVI